MVNQIESAKTTLRAASDIFYFLSEQEAGEFTELCNLMALLLLEESRKLEEIL